MKTWNAKPGEVERRWYLVDAEGKTLGRLATRIADALRGKDKPQYTPHVDTGDFVVVVNAEKVAVTGKKLDDKIYYRHSGYPGGIRSRTLREELERRPTEVIRKAVKGMLPRNRLGRAQLTKLKVYAGPEHPHEAQAPTPLKLEDEVMATAAQYQGTGKRKTSIARVILRPGDGATWINGRTLRGLLPALDAPHDGSGAAEGRRRREHLRPARAGRGRRPDRSGRRDPSRHRPCACRGGSGAAHCAQARGLPDPRRPQGRAQEGGPPQGSQSAAVLKR